MLLTWAAVKGYLSQNSFLRLCLTTILGVFTKSSPYIKHPTNYLHILLNL